MRSRKPEHKVWRSVVLKVGTCKKGVVEILFAKGFDTGHGTMAALAITHALGITALQVIK